MKITLRWQILLAVMAMALVLSLLSFQVQSSSLCSVEVPAAGGTYVEGIVGAPRYLNPLLSDANPVDQELSRLLFDGLTRFEPTTGEIVPHIADWTVSEDGRTIRFALFDGWAWHDGEPVTADDVIYTYRLMQDDAFPGAAGLKALWQAVEIVPVDAMTVEFRLQEPYAPFLEATTRGLLPAHLLQGVSAAALPEHAFNRAPVGTGPFVVAENWQENGRLRLEPAPDAWRGGTPLDAIAFQFFPDSPTMLAAFEAGQIQSINRIDAAYLPEVASSPDARLFTTLESRYTTLLFNTERVTQSLAVRQALALALDREQLIDTVLNGQGLVFDGPYLPSSWAYRPDLLTAYAPSQSAAAALLDGEGWSVVDGESVRQQDGTPLTLQLLALEHQVGLATAVSQQWAAVGIGAALTLVPDLAALQTLLRDKAFDVALFDVNPPIDPDLYDFWSQEAIVRGQNFAGWNQRRASESLEIGRQLWDVAERRPFYDTFLRLFDDALPALTLYQHLNTYIVHADVNNVDIGQITHPRERYATFANWFMHYRNVAIACPLDSTLE